MEKSVNACPCAVSVCLLSGIFDYLLMFVLVALLLVRLYGNLAHSQREIFLLALIN